MPLTILIHLFHFMGAYRSLPVPTHAHLVTERICTRFCR
jgi:hypothetical protein